MIEKYRITTYMTKRMLEKYKILVLYFIKELKPTDIKIDIWEKILKYEKEVEDPQNTYDLVEEYSDL